MNRLRYIVLYLTVLHFFVKAQDYNELVYQKENFLKETELLNQALLEASKTTNYTIEQLNIVNTKIDLQQELLNMYQKSISKLRLEQTEIEDTIIIVGNYLEKLQKNYANLIQISHRSLRKHNRLLFFLSANNFNQLVRRIYHFNQLSRQRRHKYKEIQITREKLDNKKKVIDILLNTVAELVKILTRSKSYDK